METIPVYNPNLPFVGRIPGGLRPSLMVRIRGRMRSKHGRCVIDFVNSPDMGSGQDVMFHLSIRMDERCIVRNSFERGCWKGEERYGAFRIGFGDPFEMIILAELEFYKIAVNGVHLGVFRHRLPLSLVQFIQVSGEVNVEHILFEQDVKSAQEYAKLGHAIAIASQSTTTVHHHHGTSAPIYATHNPIYATPVITAPIYTASAYPVIVEDCIDSAPIYASSAPIYSSSVIVDDVYVDDQPIHETVFEHIHEPIHEPIFEPVYADTHTTWVDDADY